jgi:hypothetical protein
MEGGEYGFFFVDMKRMVYLTLFEMGLLSP